MKIAVGSNNRAKLRAAEIAIDVLFRGAAIEPVEADSGVSKQPKSDEESIAGAINRATGAQKATGADYGIGMEGGIQKIGEEWFECGWIAVIDQDGKVGLGSSARFQVSEKMAKRLLEGEEMGEVIDDLTGRIDTKHEEGVMGIVTNGALPRDLAYSHGIIFAFAPFVSDSKYWN